MRRILATIRRAVGSLLGRRPIDWGRTDWENFRWAGGCLTPGDWCRCTPASRGAAVLAGRMQMARAVEGLARGLSGPEGLAGVVSEVDGGRALRGLVLAAEGARMLSAAEGAEVRQ